MRAQPDAIADWGSHDVPDSGPYSMAYSEPNSRSYFRSYAIRNSFSYAKV